MDFTPGDGPQHVRALEHAHRVRSSRAIVKRRAQRVGALERANQVRIARATIKRRIATGDLTAGEVILSHRQEIDRMSIYEILLSQARWGSGRCHEFLRGVMIRENKLIGSMTERQRTAVAAALLSAQPRCHTRQDLDRVRAMVAEREPSLKPSP
jgi:hypothetical protein